MKLSRNALRMGQMVFVCLVASATLVNWFVADVPSSLPLLAMLLVSAFGGAYQKACRWDSRPLPPAEDPWRGLLEVTDWLGPERVPFNCSGIRSA